MKRPSRLTFDDMSHVLLLLSFLAASVWYLMDTLGASERVENIIFVGPLALAAITLSLYILVRLLVDIRRRSSREDAVPAGSAGSGSAGSGQDAAVAPPRSFVARWRAALVALLFALYVTTLDVIGFDAGTFLFVMACLIVQGERNPLVFIGYPLVFAALVTYAFRLLVPYPFETLLF